MVRETWLGCEKSKVLFVVKQAAPTSYRGKAKCAVFIHTSVSDLSPSFGLGVSYGVSLFLAFYISAPYREKQDREGESKGFLQMHSLLALLQPPVMCVCVCVLTSNDYCTKKKSVQQHVGGGRSRSHLRCDTRRRTAPRGTKTPSITPHPCRCSSSPRE